jgi:hypothetical protein
MRTLSVLHARCKVAQDEDARAPREYVERAVEMIRLLALFVLAAALTGCGGASQVPPGPPPPRIYVTEQLCAGMPISCTDSVVLFAPPLTSTSTPQATLAQFFISTPTGPSLVQVATPGLALDPTGRLFVGLGSYGIQAFAQPISASSTALFTIPASNFNSGGIGPIAFDPFGNLAVSILNPAPSVGLISPPFSSSSTATPAASSPPAGLLLGLAFVGARLYVCSTPNLVGPGQLQAYDPPYGTATFTIPLATAPSSIAADSAGNVYVAFGNGAIHVYTAPLSSTTMPSVVMLVPGASPTGVAFDNYGNLVVAVGGAVNAIDVFTPPFTATSTPTVIVPVTGGYVPRGIMFGF